MQEINKFLGRRRYLPVIIPNKWDAIKVAVKNWGNNTPYVESIDEANAIYKGSGANGLGMILDNLLVIDIDLKYGSDRKTVRKNGYPLFKQWIEDYDLDFSEYYCEETRGGGLHYYFENDLNLNFCNPHGNDGIDTLGGKNHFSIVGGSKLYTIKNEGRIGKVSELPSDFLGMIERKKIRKSESYLEKASIVSFDEAVKVLSVFPRDYWDENGKWVSYLLCFRDTFDFDTALKLATSFMNQDDWAMRTGGVIKQTNEDILRRKPSKHDSPLTWGGVINEATDHGYIEPETLDNWDHLKNKNNDLDYPPGFAGEVIKDLENNKGVSRNIAIDLVEKMSAILFAGNVTLENRNICLFSLVVGVSGFGKSMLNDLISEMIMEIKNDDMPVFSTPPSSGTALKQILNTKPFINIKYDEINSFLKDDNSKSPLGVILESYESKVTTILPGAYAADEKYSAADTAFPVINVFGNDVHDNFEKIKNNENMVGGFKRRFVVTVYPDKLRKAKDFKKWDFHEAANCFSPPIIKKLRALKNRFEMTPERKITNISMVNNQKAAHIIYSYQAELDEVRFTSDHKDQPIYVAEQLHIRRRLARWGVLNAIDTRGAIVLSEELARWVCKQTDRSLKTHEAVYGSKQAKMDIKAEKIKEHVRNGKASLAKIAQSLRMDKDQIKKIIETDPELALKNTGMNYFTVYIK